MRFGLTARHRAAASQNALVGSVDELVLGGQALFVGMEAVAVFHQELSHAHQAAASTGLVAEFELDLVDHQRELAIGMDLLAGEIGGCLLVGHGQHHLVVAAVTEAQQRRAGGRRVIAAAGPPQFGWLRQGHEQLLPADGVHLLTYNAGDGLECPPAERKITVYAGRQLAHEAGAQRQLMAGHLGLSGHLAQSMANRLQTHTMTSRERGEIGCTARRTGARAGKRV
jgi:hypothetical protein